MRFGRLTVSGACVVLALVFISALGSPTFLVAADEAAGSLEPSTNILPGVAIANAIDDEELESLPLDKLRQRLADVEAGVRQTEKDFSEARKKLMTMRQSERRTNDAVRVIVAEIDALKVKIEKTIDELPPVKAEAESIKLSELNLVRLAKLRAKISKLIAAAEVTAKSVPGAAAK